MMSGSERKMQAFTLNEMLLVVAILLLLGAIVVSLVRMAREASTRTGCANNLKQLYASLMSYVEEYGAPPWLEENWVQDQPEIRPMLICPKDPSKGFQLSGGGPRGNPSLPGFVPTSYETVYMTKWVFKWRWENGRRIGTPVRPPTMREMTDPQQALLACTWHEVGYEEVKDPFSQLVHKFPLYQAVFGDGRIGGYGFPVEFRPPRDQRGTGKHGAKEKPEKNGGK
jgi:type II secretory pathway pseudopilin PulG